MKAKDSKALSNKYWQEMETILDKEMPVKRKKRILPWFFIWGIAGTFFVMGSILFFSQNITNSIGDLSHNSSIEPLKLNNTLNAQNGDPVHHNMSGHDNITIQSSEVKIVEANAFGETKNSAEILKNNRVAQNESIIQNDIHNSIVSNNKISDHKPNADAIIQQTDSKPIFNKTNDQISQLSNLDIRKNQFQISQLDNIKPKIFSINHNIRPIQPMVETPKNNFRFGIETETYTHDYKSIGQYNVGVLGQYTFNKRLYTFGGLQYCLFNKNVDFTQKIISYETLDETVLENIVNTSTVSSGTQNTQKFEELDVVSSITHRLHYGNISVGMGYKLSKRISLESKISNYRLISAQYKIDDEVNESLTQYGYMQFDQKQLDTKKPVHKYSMYAVGFGAHYLIDKHWSVGFESIWWPSKNENVDNNRNANTSTSLDNTESLFSNTNNQRSTISAGLKLRYMW